VLDVSVIIPVYNPGGDIEDCIRSVIGQTLPPDAYEVIFVDDGSTDDTPARLDELAAGHDNVRVEHIPNSGWPGKPRNVGLALAQGEYVYFVDNDDWIEDDALELLVANARANGSDVVIGKVVGHGKYVPRGLFLENRDEINLESRALLGLLTPHKLFRKGLLDEHGIRFPEGKRRLEDHVFVMHTYFHADRISVLADQPIYHWMMRKGDNNASYQAFDPVGYYGNVREVLDLIAEHTEPGPFRDRLSLHWYRGKMLQRVGGPNFPKRTPDHRRALVEEVRKLALERYPPEVADPLPFNLRLRSHVLREGKFESLEKLGDMEAALRGRVRVTKSLEDEEGVRTLHWTGQLKAPDGPFALRRRGDRVYWEPLEDLDEDLPQKLLDVTIAVFKPTVQILLRSTSDRTEFVLPGEVASRLQPIDKSDPDVVTAQLSGEAVIDPRTAAAGSPLPAGEWEVLAVVNLLGFTHTSKVRRGKRRAPIIVGSTGDGLVDDPQTKKPKPPPTLRRRLAARARWLGRLVRRGTGADRAAG
jgi:glycosyltransferase involved in cell wall biosynthesis